MSYILEALRKSERDRLAAQTPTLPNLLTDPPRRRPHWGFWLLGGLLLLNGLGLAWLWFHGWPKPAAQSAATPSDRPMAVAALPPTQPVPGITSAQPALPKAIQADTPSTETIRLDAVPPANPAPKPSASVAAPVVRKPPPPQASTEGKGIPKAIHPPQSGPRRVPKPAQPAEPEEEAEMLTEAEEAMPVPEPPVMSRRLPRPSAAQRLPPPIKAAPMPEDEEAAAPESHAHDGIPWLSAMPMDFRQRVPQFNINIFAYSPAPEERFAIIDMRKYRVGDRIPGDALLLDIRPDCLVLELDGQRFKFPRP